MEHIINIIFLWQMLQCLYCQSSDICKDVLGTHTIVIYPTGIKIVLLDSWKMISSKPVNNQTYAASVL